MDFKVDLSWAAGGGGGGGPQCNVLLHTFSELLSLQNCFSFCVSKNICCGNQHTGTLFSFGFEKYGSVFFSSSGVHADVDIVYWW